MPSSEGKWRLLNPLTIRFSQPRIAPHFRDGHLIDETAEEVYEVPLEADACNGPAPADAAAGPPPYDVVLMTPFPAIRAISWLPRIRRPDGEAERDEYGDHKLGRRAWFALDNRRLHSMQRAAARRWPRRCCVAVRCVEEVPGSTIRELRKFRTTTEGRSIEVGVRAGETQPWRWLDAAPPGAREDGLEAEGLYTEDLWDAVRWAPQAVAAATKAECAAENGDFESPVFQKGVFAHCPDTGWQYVDPSGKIQGPFDLAKMRLWHRYSFFYPELPMRCHPEDAFKPFAELFPDGAEPFRDRVLRHKL
mmetsp:Transcript_23311/g.66338  ORF Transcript_23311/g.66338 Transcript_23311/m.66338 type:complete len:306 (+) Transcript_23311:104-1021(+)